MARNIKTQILPLLCVFYAGWCPCSSWLTIKLGLELDLTWLNHFTVLSYIVTESFLKFPTTYEHTKKKKRLPNRNPRPCRHTFIINWYLLDLIKCDVYVSLMLHILRIFYAWRRLCWYYKWTFYVFFSVLACLCVYMMKFIDREPHRSKQWYSFHYPLLFCENLFHHI